MRRTHGMSRTQEYIAYKNMIYRCYNPTKNNYERYGGRGITVCDRWRDSFENFLEDVGKCPGSEYSLDRIDNGKEYCPSNCKWNTLSEQMNNTRRNVTYEWNGKSQTISQWIKELNLTMKRMTVVGRLRQGWSIGEALTRKVDMRTVIKRHSVNI